MVREQREAEEKAARARKESNIAEQEKLAREAEERAAIDSLMATTRAALTLQDPALIEAATQTLAKGTEAFAALRMNRGIQQALAGRNIETV